jgi:HK97 family phage major capsid protein
LTPPIELVEAAQRASDDVDEALKRYNEAEDDDARAAALAEFEAAEAEAERVETQIKMTRKAEDLRAKLPEAPKPEPVQTAVATLPAMRVEVGKEPLTYGREKHGKDAQRSFLRDMKAVVIDRDMAPMEHLQRHVQEMAIETRDSTTTDTTSLGEMVPPMWLVEEFAAIARAGRPFANAIGSRDLPVGTENIIVPKVTTGGSVHFQTAQNTAIAEQDMVTGGTAQAVVKTIAGQIDTSLQSVDWAAINMVDGFFLPELASLHSFIFETSVGAANNTNGAWQGVIGTAGTQTVTYTSATPTAGSLYAKISDAIQQIHTNRFLPPDLIVMHPRRWGWLTAQSDSTGRPLFLPLGFNPQNPQGLSGGVVSEGIVGSTGHGLPVLVSSAAIVTNDSAGTTNDVVLVVRTADLWLWESDIRTRVLTEVLSGQLSVRIQLYNYSATMFDRYPKSISAIRGTGLATPTFP